MENKTRKPEPPKTPPEHEEEHLHGNPQFALKVLLILLAVILVIVILKFAGVPFALKDLLSHLANA